MKIMPLYDLGNEAEVGLLMKKLKDNTVGSIEDLPDNMILLVAENANPTMTLKELNDKVQTNGELKTELLRTDDGVFTNEHRIK